MKKSLLVIAVLAAMVASSSSVRAGILAPEASDPDACHASKVTTEKCGVWNVLNVKESPDACRTPSTVTESCTRWYSVGEAPKPVKEKVIVLKGVRFDTASAKIRSDSLPILEKNVDELTSSPKTKIRIVGHTDSRGGDDYNQKLSEQRAQSVLEYFVSKGVNRDRIAAEGRGESEPVADNNTDSGRFENRRIEIRIR